MKIQHVLLKTIFAILKFGKNTLIASAIIITLLGSISMQSNAETLHLKQNIVKTLDKPSVGMTRDAVRTKYGAPSELQAGVGQPPIEKWMYPTFSVYFENNTVIHAVAHPVVKP